MLRAKAFFLKHNTLLVIYIIVTIIASVHLVMLGLTHRFHGNIFGVEIPWGNYTHYNNYVIFKQSFFHLIQGKDMYALYINEQWDLYKYSPTFALAMGLLAWMPDMAGVILWNLLNSIALFAAIKMLPFDKKTTALALWFILLETLTAVQSTQSNALMAALLIAAWALMERRKLFWATFMLVAATYIKVYGAIGFAFFLFYPQKPKFILYSALWTVLFTVAPLLVTSPDMLMKQYESWIRLMGMDQSISYGLSVMGWLHTWFGVNRGRELVMVLGVMAFFIPLMRYKLYSDVYYRLMFLAYTLVWVIIFNHKAESSTFVIALAGIAIWYFAKPKHNLGEKILLWLVFIFTCLSPTDLFPFYVRHDIFLPYMIKVVPCIGIWAMMFVELLRYKPAQPLPVAAS